MSLATVDLTDVRLYAEGNPHLVWQTLRQQAPVFWQQRAAGEGFWAVTLSEDVRTVLADHRRFSSEHGTALTMLDKPDPGAGLMMHSSDPPRHTAIREQLAADFSTRGIARLRQQIRAIAEGIVARGREGSTFDIGADFVELPVAVAALMMGLPNQDVPLLTRLAYAALAPEDESFQHSAGGDTGGGGTASWLTHLEIIDYFADRLDQTDPAPPDTDVVHRLRAVEVAGCPLSRDAVLANCLSLLLGAVVTTSQVIASTMLALVEQHGGDGHWPASMDSSGFLDETLRWSTPVTHFMRRATTDVVLGDQLIRKGDAVTAWIASASRDERHFDRPYEFNPDRRANRHLAFGAGVHRCLGANLARLMLSEAFAVLRRSLSGFTLAGRPIHLKSNEIAGIRSLPMTVAWSTTSAVTPGIAAECLAEGSSR